MVKQFSSASATKKPIKFEIDGVGFSFHPPKRAGLLLSAIADEGIRGTLDWMTKGLSTEHYDADQDSDHARLEVDKCGACVLVSMLKDESSDFDIEQLGEVFAWLVEETSARPSGKPSA